MQIKVKEKKNLITLCPEFVLFEIEEQQIRFTVVDFTLPCGPCGPAGPANPGGPVNDMNIDY